MTALLFMPVVSRWAMVYAIFAFPYARPAGLGKAYKKATRLAAILLFLSVFTFGDCRRAFPAFLRSGFLLIGGILIITTVLGLYFKYKFAGLTGDTYGAINEVAEVMALVFVIIIFKVAPGYLK